jgi:hypothetical protein
MSDTNSTRIPQILGVDGISGTFLGILYCEKTVSRDVIPKPDRNSLGERVHKSHIGYLALFVFCIGLINADGIYPYVPILGAKPHSAVRARLVEHAVIVSVALKDEAL